MLVKYIYNLYFPCISQSKEEADTHHTTPQSMKVRRQNNTKNKVIPRKAHAQNYMLAYYGNYE